MPHLNISSPSNSFSFFFACMTACFAAPGVVVRRSRRRSRRACRSSCGLRVVCTGNCAVLLTSGSPSFADDGQGLLRGRRTAARFAVCFFLPLAETRGELPELADLRAGEVEERGPALNYQLMNSQVGPFFARAPLAAPAPAPLAWPPWRRPS